MTAPPAGLVEVEVPMGLSVVLVRLAWVRMQQPWVLGEIMATVEKQFGAPTVDGKSERMADSLQRSCPLALLLDDVEEGEVLGAELTRDEVGEVLFKPTSCLDRLMH